MTTETLSLFDEIERHPDDATAERPLPEAV
jgi:hypothetical protein